MEQHLINTLMTRHNRWLQFRAGITVRARVTFTYLLSERKFRGTLSIDHKKRLLDIHVGYRVQPETDAADETRCNPTVWSGAAMAGKQDALWRGEVVLDRVPVAVAVGRHGIAHPVPG